MNAGVSAAWLATALIPSTAVAGFVLRRFVTGAFGVRLRPHFVLGYLTFAFAALHGAIAMADSSLLGAVNLWLAWLAFAGLALQTFVGLSLQAPGSYRLTLRRWHVTATWTLAALVAGHILLTM
jgi:Ni,Fe-hydrogenase I cytochrome b subunit